MYLADPGQEAPESSATVSITVWVVWREGVTEDYTYK